MADEPPAPRSERLRQLQEEFARSLPERVGELRERLKDAQTGGTEALHALEDCAHKLSGTLASFGFAAMSEAARILEKQAQVARGDPAVLTSLEASLNRLDALLGTAPDGQMEP